LQEHAKSFHGSKVFVLKRTCHIIRQTSINALAQHNGLILNRNTQASSPLIEQLKPPYHKWNKSQKVIRFYQLSVCQQKWLRTGFEPIPASTRDVLWIEVVTII